MRASVKVPISGAIVLLVTLVVVISAPAAARHATLALRSSSAGLAVSGHGFISREKVVLRATSSAGTVISRVTASPKGTFVTRLDVESGCSTVAVTARGGSGTRAAATTNRPAIAEPCGIVTQP